MGAVLGEMSTGQCFTTATRELPHEVSRWGKEMMGWYAAVCQWLVNKVEKTLL